MMEFTQVALALVGYRLATILVGLVFAYLGYKLFCKGIYEKSGDFKANLGKFSFILKQGAPGIFFALFGVIVISISLNQGIDIDRIKSIPATAENVPQGPAFFSYVFPSAANTGKDLDAILEKAVNGQSLTNDERRTLKEWYQQLKRTQESWHYKAYQPPPPKPGEFQG